MRLDPKLRPPAILPENIKISTNTSQTRTLYLAFAGLIAFSVLYLIFSYWLQNDGDGWRFLHFWHPWVTIPFWGLFFGWLIFDLFIGKLLGSLSGTSKNETSILFKGKPAFATVVDAKQTGTYINEQPQIQFKLQFTDHQGQLRTAAFKKVISLMHLHTLDKSDRIILYLPENPQEVMFAEDYIHT